MYSRAAVCLWVAFIAHAGESAEMVRQPVRDLAVSALQYCDIAARLHAAGNYRDAETQYARSIEAWEKAYGTEHPGLVRLLNSLASLYLDSRQFAKSETVTRRSLELQRASPGVMPATDEATTFIHLGSVHRALRKLDESESAYLEAEAILQREVPPDRSVIANVWNNLAALYADWGRVERAAFYLERSVTQLGEDCSQEAAKTLINLAWISNRAGRLGVATNAFSRAADCAREAFGGTHRQTADTLTVYAQFLRARNRKREAARLEREARQIRARVAAVDSSRYVVDARELQAKRR
jgi:tetratricopeptide (TPR) repeat protein